jgi:HlyD family secretion protein
VDEANIAPVRVGQEATVFVNAYPDREYRGVVRQIGLKRQVGTDGTGTFEVEISLELSEGETLYSGLTASTDIAVERFFDTIRVPSQAVMDRRVDELPTETRDNPLVDRAKTFTRVVYKVVEGKTVITPVRAGASDLTGTQVLEGLAQGDVIVTGPFRALVNLKHDQAVRDEKLDKKDADGKPIPPDAKDGADETEPSADTTTEPEGSNAAEATTGD